MTMGALLFFALSAVSAAVAAVLGTVLGFAMGWGWRGAVDQGRLHVQNRAFRNVMRRLGISFDANK